MVRLVSKDYKPLEQIIKEKKISEISLKVIEMSDRKLVFEVLGDGKVIHITHIQNYPLPTEIFILKLKSKKKEFPLELSSIEVNVGIVKAKFSKKK